MIPAIGNDLSQFSLNASEETDQGKLGQHEFLKLMITQLENQDPFKPLESGEFLGQLAQFGTVSGLAELQTSFEGLASSLVSNQALQAAGIIGQSVLAEGGTAYHDDVRPLGGAVDLPASSIGVRVRISDAAGRTVRELELGPQAAGLVSFQWDGVDADGGLVEAGPYTVTAEYFDGGEMQRANTLVRADVQSVAFGPDGFSVQLRGLGEVPFSAIREIG